MGEQFDIEERVEAWAYMQKMCAWAHGLRINLSCVVLLLWEGCVGAGVCFQGIGVLWVHMLHSGLPFLVITPACLPDHVPCMTVLSV